MSLATNEGEEEKKTVKKIGTKNFTISLSLSQEQLEVECRDISTKRLFAAKFTREDLSKCGFHPNLKLDAIQKTIQTAINGVEKTIVEIGYIKGETKLDSTKVNSSYRKGDQLVIIIEHDTGLFAMTYALVLIEVEQNETEILQEVIKEMRDQMTIFQTQIQTLEKKNEEKVIALQTKIQKLEKENEEKEKEKKKFQRKNL